ncbi:peptidoglycan-binding protein [Kitasatospora sp. NPDC057692]|uniref:peptidoglycan-binding protein n=1 Tax=Kitasatospora sp. NPDC057692 TaxID=3346215 RepID=UPI0036BC8B60
MLFVSRSEWGARPPRNDHPPVSSNQGVKVHYLGSPYSAGEHGTCAGYMRKLQNSHMDGNGWSDFAYNLAVCEHGYVFEGRGRNAQNAANGNTTLNRGHFAVVAFVGDSGHTSPTAEQVAGLRDAIAYLRANGAGGEIRGHRDGYATDCPGGPLYQLVTSGALEPGAGSPPAPGAEQPAEPTNEPPAPARYRVTVNGLEYGYGAHGDQVTAVGQALIRHGFGGHYAVGPGPDWSDADTRNYQAFQQSLGYSGADADGVPGEASLRALLGELPGDNPPPFPGRECFRQGASNDFVRLLGEQLVRKGYGRFYTQGPGPRWTDADRRNVQAFQEAQGWRGADADGYPGPGTWARLFS